MSTLGETSYKQTKFGILPHSKIIQLEVEGTKRALEQLQKIATTNRYITSEFIKDIHKIGFEDILQEDVGKFRTIQVTYSSKEAPHFTKLPEMMKNLCEDTEYSILHLPAKESEEYISLLVEILARFQHRFVFIHPFVDYNGRISRLFTNYILMRLGLPIIEIKVENETDRKAYISALQRADESDYEMLDDIIAKSLAEGLSQV